VSVTVTPSAAPSTGPAPESATDAKCEQPGLALAVLFDRSGSMQGRPIEMARAAAKAAADGLHTGDYLEVIAFDSAPARVVPMTKMGSEREKATAKIEKIQAGGGTQFFAALDMVYQDLADVSTCRKHVVFLSDGMAPTAGIKELVQAMVAESITISTVGLGSSVDVVLLRQISDIGGGRFYSVSDPDKLPAIFAADVLAAEKTVDLSL